MRIYSLKAFILTIVIISCNQQPVNNKDIKIYGCIIDNLSKKPISNANVTILCWYHSGWDKTDYTTIDTIADINGCFNVNFDEGYKVIIASVASKYQPNLIESDKFDNSVSSIKLELKKNTDLVISSKTFNLRNYIIENSNN